MARNTGSRTDFGIEGYWVASVPDANCLCLRSRLCARIVRWFRSVGAKGGQRNLDFFTCAFRLRATPQRKHEQQRRAHAYCQPPDIAFQFIHSISP